ncbi:MAG: hypothetical protein OXE43_13695 [Chloroflexi bacterium]|nr:hypothetical protein [Chloroflexota bacterium]
MLSLVAKTILVATSLSPVLVAVAVTEFERGQSWTGWIGWLIAALALAVLCWLVLHYASNSAQHSLIYIKDFESKDQEMIVFLFIYLLPFIRSANSTFASEWMTSIYVLGIIVVAIAHGDAFHFNPVMRLFGYRFYSVRNREGLSLLLISRRDLHRNHEEVQAVRLAWNVYLHEGESDA